MGLDPLSPLVVRTLTWRLLPILCLGLGIGHLDRQNIAYAELMMGPELNLTKKDFAVASGVFFLTYATFQVPFTHIAAGHAPGLVLGISLVAQGAIAGAQGLVRSGTELCVLRVLLGVPEAVFYPVAALYISRWFPDQHRALAMTIFQAFSGLGFLIGGLSAGAIMDAADGLIGWSGWRWLFVVQGLPSILLGVITICLLPNRIGEAAWLSLHQREELALHLLASDVADEKPLPLARALWAVLRRGPTWTCASLHFSVCTIAYMVAFFLPTMTKELLPSWSLTAAGLLCTIPSAMAMAVGPCIASIADRHGASLARRLLITYGCDVLAAFTLLGSGLCMYAASVHAGAAAHRWSVGALALVFCAFPMLASSAGPFWALHHAVQPTRLRAVSIATVNSIGNVGGFAGPYLLAALRQALGPECPSAAQHKCISQWAFGTLSVALGVLCLITASGVTATALLLFPSREPLLYTHRAVSALPPASSSSGASEIETG